MRKKKQSHSMQDFKNYEYQPNQTASTNSA